MTHPPWLRFQAYVVGLPKTGSTSLATVFGRYRTGHEWQMYELLSVALRRVAGEIDDEQFWVETTPRLTRPSLEMDSATSHHLYADLLVQRFPHAVFIHSIRDVGGWISSLLDMALRYDIGRSLTGRSYTSEESTYVELIAGGTLYPHGRPAPERECIVPMMRYWEQHMTRMSRALPADRSLTVRTEDLASHLDELAALCGVPVESLRADLVHANAAPRRLDRLAAFASPQLLAAYRAHCADLMGELFPAEHERTLAALSADPQGSWDDHYADTRQWVVDLLADNPDLAFR